MFQAVIFISFYVSLGFNGRFVRPNLAEFRDTARSYRHLSHSKMNISCNEKLFLPLVRSFSNVDEQKRTKFKPSTGRS